MLTKSHQSPQVSANASLGFDEIASVDPSQTLYYQLYVNRDRSKTEEILKKVVKAGYKGICVTVDAPVAGKRERDERAAMDLESASDPGFQKAATAKEDVPDAPDVANSAQAPDGKAPSQSIAAAMGS